MTEQSEPGEQDTATLLLKVFEERMTESVATEEEMDYRAQQSAQQTQKITKISLYVAFIFTPVIFYLIGTLVLAMGTITDRMKMMAEDVGSMKHDFDQVSALMKGMDASVVNMSNNIKVIPEMATQVAGMNGNFTEMVGAMQRITPEVGNIDHLLGGMDKNMDHMNGLFGHMNRNVLFMSRDVNTLSSPMRMIPFFGR